VLLVQRLFVEYQPAIRAFISALVPDFNRAQDVLQETFLTTTRKAEDFVPESNYLGWVCAIARYKVLEARRQGKFVGLTEAAIEGLCSRTPDLPGPCTEALAQCIDRLAPRARQAITLRYEGSHSPAEVASIMGWTPEGVYVALSRARHFLRKCVEERLAAIPGG
jgi:RNA polymerase sigma-70 factor (ECF subfamily)